jgi:hypothetical protein
MVEQSIGAGKKGRTARRFLSGRSIGVTKKMSNRSSEGDVGGDGDDRSHLEDVEPGAGCTEIWETLSERRAEPEPADD